MRMPVYSCTRFAGYHSGLRTNIGGDLSLSRFVSIGRLYGAAGSSVRIAMFPVLSRARIASAADTAATPPPRIRYISPVLLR